MFITYIYISYAISSDFFFLFSLFRGDGITHLSKSCYRRVSRCCDGQTTTTVSTIQPKRWIFIIYYSDATRNIKAADLNTYDLPAFDALRARDRGI